MAKENFREAICRVLSGHDFEVTGNGRSVKILRGMNWWVLNFDTGNSTDRVSRKVAERVAVKYIKTGVVPKYNLSY